MDEPDEVGGLTGRVAGIPGRHANLHVSRLGADCTRNRARDRQLGPLPCIEAADNVDDIRVPGSLQQAAGNHAAIAALAMDCDRRVMIDLW